MQARGSEHAFDVLDDPVELKVLRESPFATVRAEGTRRVYAVDTRPLAEADAWLNQVRQLWGPRLESLAAEIGRGKRRRRLRGR
jgi:hypothetical protein